MEELPSSSARGEDDAPPSPKRKKIRAKYAPKACVTCRRSKLKCSGENPCQRCSDNGRRCIYSEDQTAAEALQSLSRPTQIPPLHSSGNGLSRRSILPRNGTVERRASDASVLGISMEQRMSRIENMMEVLIQDRGVGMTPSGSLEREDSVSESFLGEAALQAPDALYAAADSAGHQRGASFDAAYVFESFGIPPISATGPSQDMAGEPSAPAGSRTHTLPTPTEHRKYLDAFFTEINPYQPCIDEAGFRTRCEHILATGSVAPNELSLLALNYLIFACVDITWGSTPPGVPYQAPGWRWYKLGDELMGGRRPCSGADLDLMQYLIYETYFLMHADEPNAAYNVIGTACRLSFQLGLQRRSTAADNHMRQRIFWTIYYLDRRISLSCGRPYGIRDSDIDVDPLSWICEKDLNPNLPDADPDESRSADGLLAILAGWAKHCGIAWDQIFAPSSAERRTIPDMIVIDGELQRWPQIVLGTIPQLSRTSERGDRHQRIHLLTHIRASLLRLRIHRMDIMNLTLESPVGVIYGDIAVDIVQRIQHYAMESTFPEHCRFEIVIALAQAIWTLCALLIQRDSLRIQEKREVYVENFKNAITWVHSLAAQSEIARRISNDLKDIVQVALSTLDTNIVPTDEINTRKLFPYRDLDFAHQVKLNGARDNRATDGSLTFTNGPATAGYGSRRVAGAYGVPWI
ncbi:fungal-specific transcription factor domain-containing protein [Lophiotrema nucula]|uniref:Fungal-specific transcription factor domain-containing protein n=1 Tax=Lophiotrema nucula TaxID=690887 RepID=A0A6A5ZFB1_9PLEO|nr:fungal-specific transcription factor domain-containing protein [Lophiotrema nucula]